MVLFISVKMYSLILVRFEQGKGGVGRSIVDDKDFVHETLDGLQNGVEARLHVPFGVPCDENNTYVFHLTEQFNPQSLDSGKKFLEGGEFTDIPPNKSGRKEKREVIPEKQTFHFIRAEVGII